MQFVCFYNSRTLHFFMAKWTVVDYWLSALGERNSDLNQKHMHFKQSILDSQGRVINSWSCGFNQTSFTGFLTVMVHELNAPQRPRGLGTAEINLLGPVASSA